MTVKSKTKAKPIARPTQQEIAERAYLLWVSEGRPRCRALNNWLLAEAFLEAECAKGNSRKRTGKRAGGPR